MSDEESESLRKEENPYASPQGPSVAKAGLTIGAGCLAAFCGFLACFTTCTGTAILAGSALGILPLVLGIVVGGVVWWRVQEHLHKQNANAISIQDEPPTDK